MFEYSVTIRTLGTAGKKYQNTLDCISRQTISPKQVFVILPEGYSLPKERLGNELFVYSNKGMVSQRISGFQICQTEYLLALDDDVDFDNDFVEKLFETIVKTNADFASPIVKECKMGGVKYTLSSKIKDWCLGVSCRRALKEPFVVKIWRTGGFIVNANIQADKQYYNQSGHGTCIFGKTKALRDLHFEDELWLQDTKYALPDDMVMFYKLYLQGNKIAMNTQVRFVHMDAGASLANEDKKRNNLYASARNGFIFWHRFIYRCETRTFDKIVSIACILRRILFTIFFAFLKGIYKRDMSNATTYINGYVQAWKFVHSVKYKELRPILPSFRGGGIGKLKKIYSFGLFHGIAYVLFVLSLKLFHGNNPIKSFCRNMHDTAVKRYGKRTCKNVIKKYNEQKTGNKPIPNNCPIWVFWWQGERNMPPIVKCCLESIKKHADNHPVKIVTQHNIDKYLNIPQHIITRMHQNTGGMMQGMSFIHFSDYVRMALLWEHGGIWLDATCFLSAPLSISRATILTSIRTNYLEKIPNKGLWNIYYLGAAKHNALFGFLKDMISEYWKNNEFIIDYFFTDYCIGIAYDLYPDIRQMIDELPLLHSNHDSHSIYFLLNHAYDINTCSEILSNVSLHKLTWKGKLNIHTKEGKLTFYGWILNNGILE